MTDLDTEALVSFGAPPVAEVVTAVHFSPMSPMSFLSIGSLCEAEWRSRFPRFDMQPPYQPPVESFNKPGMPSSAAMEFGFRPIPPLPRVWLTSASGTELLQLQVDWFAANWRRDAVPGYSHAPFAHYDRWGARRQAFARNWQALNEWLADRGETIAPNQCEVTYINHIRPIEGLWSSHGQADKVFNGIDLPVADGCESEQFGWRAQYLIPREENLPESRLHVSVAAAYAGPGPEPSPIIVFELTVRGAPPTDGDMLRFYDRGRRTIVKSFVQMTSREAREAWGQE